MDVSISKRVMPLFGLLCAGALMCASALFLPDGAMATNTVIDGYRIGPDGKWIP